MADLALDSSPFDRGKQTLHVLLSTTTSKTNKQKKRQEEGVKFLIDTELEAYLLAATGAPLEAINVTPIANDC